MTSSDPGHASPGPSLWGRIQSGAIERFHIRLESLIVLLVLGVAMSVLSPYFLSISNFMNIFLASGDANATVQAMLDAARATLDR